MCPIEAASLAPVEFQLRYPESWRPTLNPFAALAQRAAGRWFRELGVVRDETTERVLREERPDLYGGLPYPTASFDTLTLVTKYLALWMLFDDLVTESAGPGQGPSLTAYATALDDGVLPDGADGWLRGWWRLGRELAQRMSGAWCRRLSGAFLAWLQMTVRERETYRALRDENRLPDLACYLDIRSISVGAVPTFYFIELVGGFALPEAVLSDEKLRALHALGARLVLAANDVLGLQKDLRSGWPNLVTVLQQDEQVPLAEACARAVALHNREVLAFLALEASLPSFGAELDPLVRCYVERMHLVIAGFAEFERQAERYRWDDSDGAPFRVALAYADA